MALLFMDSFDHYATADITEKWTQATASNGTYSQLPDIGSYGRNSTQGVRFKNAASISSWSVCARALAVVVAPADNEVIVGFAFKQANLGFDALAVGIDGYSDWTSYCNNNNIATNLLVGIRIDGTSQIWAQITEAGTITVYRNATVLGTTSIALQIGVYAYIELGAVIHSSTGSVVLRIDGVEALNLSGINTAGAGSNNWNEVVIGKVQGDDNSKIVYWHVDDFVLMDGSGSYNNAFIGDVTISILKPNGAGNSTDWTPSAGSNYQCVDEALVNDDTDYVSSSTLNAKDLYAMEDCAAGADIRAVQVVTAMRKGTEGPGKIKHVVRSNSTDYDSAEIGLGGTAYSFNRSIWETDPATAVPWTESGWNAAQVGVKKTG